ALAFGHVLTPLRRAIIPCTFRHPPRPATLRQASARACRPRGDPMPVTRFEETRRRPLAGGRAFGDAGRYEELLGRIHLSIDPRHAANRAIAAPELAPPHPAPPAPHP